jgi:hypothetical protein
MSWQIFPHLTRGKSQMAETENRNRNSDAAFRTIPRRVSVFKGAKKYLNLFFSSTSAAYKSTSLALS